MKKFFCFPSRTRQLLCCHLSVLDKNVSAEGKKQRSKIFLLGIRRFTGGFINFHMIRHRSVRFGPRVKFYYLSLPKQVCWCVRRIFWSNRVFMVLVVKPIRTFSQWLCPKTWRYTFCWLFSHLPKEGWGLPSTIMGLCRSFSWMLIPISSWYTHKISH